MPCLQVCDFWAFATSNAGKDGLLKSFMSMHHSRDHMRKHIPAPGDVFVTSQSKRIMTFLEDTGPGAHDTTVRHTCVGGQGFQGSAGWRAAGLYSIGNCSRSDHLVMRGD